MPLAASVSLSAPPPSSDRSGLSAAGTNFPRQKNNPRHRPQKRRNRRVKMTL
ncbi:hypothetical protein FH063_001405 [Azospirillum argentinense]|uniref:Uncharacterized protein n=1 Tax=Azospirillum argentinense TaxID=2970906 RepID=A0A5B0KWX8_9PROT|nr:hypothetical protein FH063_001405 [Azospirillum argentinense]